jgi:hypothetical protein
MQGNVSGLYRKCIDLINHYNRSYASEFDEMEIINKCNRLIRQLNKQKMAVIENFGENKKVTKSIRSTIGNYNYMISTIVGKAKSKGIDLEKMKNVDNMSEQELRDIVYKKFISEGISESRAKKFLDEMDIGELRLEVQT